ncbi:MAG: ABC transporter ATP-binding protein [Aldersonia sp.]|nr:ABC transporter ATP-binding protein [Aldersonia sp.]
MGKLLRVDNLQIELVTTRGIIRAVDGVSFALDPGETVTIIGESGSGKSTTGMGILGLLPTDLAVVSGSVQFKNNEILNKPGELGKIRGRHIALIPQDPMTALSPVHAVGSQLREAIRHSGITGKGREIARAVELLDQVHIPDPTTQLDKYPHQFSGGMLQRILIAGALAAGPELIVADEPTSALDVTVQASILDLLLELQETTGVGLLLITHDLGVARLMSDRIYVMKDGRFVENGGADDMVHRPQSPYTQKLLAAVPTLGDSPDTAPPAPIGATA